eukprot:Platyproteum_vivax@DN8233_c0_g1_i1.p1
MNFFAAGLLWHAGTEEGCFWLLQTLMRKYDVRSMFLEGLPGLCKRTVVVERLMNHFCPLLISHMASIGATVQLLCCDWLMTLFAYSIPLENLTILWNSFFELGWVAIYRLVMQRMLSIQDSLLEIFDIAEFMQTVKFGPQEHLTTSRGRSGGGNAPGFSTKTFWIGSGGDWFRSSLLSGSFWTSNDPNFLANKAVWGRLIERSKNMLELEEGCIPALEAQGEAQVNEDATEKKPASE